MSSAAATSLISTPDRLLSFTAVALNRSPYLATLRDPALATTHLQAVSPRCQLIRGNLADEMILVVSPELIAAHGEPETLEDIARMPTLSMASGYEPLTW